MIVNKQLSPECREVIAELKRAAKGGKIGINVTALALSGGYVWGVIFAYYDDESNLVAEETYYTMKGSTRRVSGFVVLFDEEEIAFDGEMYNPLLPEKSKTISDFIVGLIGEGITPSLFTEMHVGLEETVECGIEGVQKDPAAVYPCSECEDAKPPGEVCEDCECAVCDVPTCTEEIRLKCDANPFDSEDEEDEEDEDDEDDEGGGEE